MLTIKFNDLIYTSDSVQCEEYFDDYLPNKGWTLEYLLKSSDTIININNITADSVRNVYIISLTSDDTKAYEPGNYTLFGIFTNTSLNQRQTLNLKPVQIKAELTQSGFSDYRSWAEIALENVEAYLSKTATLQQKMYKIGDREVQQYEIIDLMNLRATLKLEIARDQQGANKKRGRGKIYIRFTQK